MVVCKHFLRGECRFGNSCNFQHQIPGNDGGYNQPSQVPSVSVMRRSNPAPSQSATPQTTDITALIKSMIIDVEGVLKGGQWPLSCYAPFKERPAYPGLEEDLSPEEVRWGYYEARQNGTLEQFNVQMGNLLQATATKLGMLNRNPPLPETITTIRNVYQNQPPENHTGFGQTPFIQQQQTFSGSGNIFGSPQSNIFATPDPKSGNIFAEPPKMFATANGKSGNIFAEPPNMFASSTQPNIFPATEMQQPMFESTDGNVTKNIFGPAEVKPANVFAQPTPQSNLFVTPQSANMFVAPQNIPSQPQSSTGKVDIFGKSTFGQPTSSNNLFANPGQQSVFGGGGQSEEDDIELYSKLEDLTKEELKWFEDLSDLSIENIPLKPPPKSLCFA